jgi:hypothetical protein
MNKVRKIGLRTAPGSGFSFGNLLLPKLKQLSAKQQVLSDKKVWFEAEFRMKLRKTDQKGYKPHRRLGDMQSKQEPVLH